MDWYELLKKSKVATPFPQFKIAIPDLFIKKYVMADGIIKPEAMLTQKYVEEEEEDVEEDG